MRWSLLLSLAAALMVGTAGAAVSADVEASVPSITQVSPTRVTVSWPAAASGFHLVVSRSGSVVVDTTSEGSTMQVDLPADAVGRRLAYDLTSLVGEGQEPMAARGEFATRPSSVTVRLMTYNLCTQRCRAITLPTPARLRGMVAQRQPDVLAVQEAGARTSRVHRRLVAALDDVGYQRAAGHSGTYLFYRYRTMSARTPDDGHLWGRTVLARHTRRTGTRPAPVQELRHRATGARLVVAGYHLTALDTARKDRARANEHRDVERVIAAWRRTHPGVPVFEIGDFNSLVQQQTRRYDSDSHRQRVWKAVRQAGLTDAVMVASTRSQHRLNTINQRSSDRRRFGPGRHLDHIFVPRRTPVKAWGLISRDVAYSNQLSDHDPVWADVEVGVTGS